MTRKTSIIGLLAALLGSASAHHSFAMFAMDKTATISGTVTEWQWTNPHSWLELDVVKPDGSKAHYSFESRSIYLLSRGHVTRHTMFAGQKVTVTYNPLRDGGNGGSLVGATAADGTVLVGRNGPAGPPPEGAPPGGASGAPPAP